MDLASLRNLQRGLPLLKRMLGRGEKHIRLVVNRYHPDNDISLEDVQRTLGITVYHTLCNDYEGVSRSISTGKPIVLNGNSKFSRDMKALGAQVTGHPWRRATAAGALPRRCAALLRPRVQEAEGVTRMTANPNSVPPGSGPAPKVRLPWEKPPAADQPAPPAAGPPSRRRRPTGEGASAPDRLALLPAGQEPGPPAADRAAQPLQPGAGRAASR